MQTGHTALHLEDHGSQAITPAPSPRSHEIQSGTSLIASGNEAASHSSGNEYTHVREPRFATKELICPWFPQADPEHKRAHTFSSFMSRRRTVLCMACISSCTIFIINLSATLYPALRFHDSRLYVGSCSTVARLDSGLHVAINGLSSLLLGASNLCMQLLSAPTRKEVDNAHAYKRWLDIGIPSVRNLKYIAKRRMVVWFFLAFSSLPLHFLWNSAISSARPENEYLWSVVTPSFLDGQGFNVTAANNTVADRGNIEVAGYHWGHWIVNWNGPPWGSGYTDLGGSFNTSGLIEQLDTMQEGLMTLPRSQFEAELHVSNLTRLECLTRYLTFDRDASNLIMVSSRDIVNELLQQNVNRTSGTLNAGNNSLLAFGFFESGWTNIVPGTITPWECGTSNRFRCEQPWTWLGNDSLVEFWNVQGYKIDYCLSQTRTLEHKCSIRFEVPIMIVVCICNLCKCLCIIYTTCIYSGNRNIPLSTLGDAAVSFLKAPDSSTTNMSLASRQNVDAVWKTKSPQRWEPFRHRWYAVASKRLWIGAIVSCLAVWLIAIALFIDSIREIFVQVETLHFDVAGFGFGSPDPYEPVPFLGHSLVACILFANIWQVLISLLYVQYNALLTAFLVGDEWSRFATVDLSGQNRIHAKAFQDQKRADVQTSKAPPSWVLRTSRRLRSFVKRIWPAIPDVSKPIRRALSPVTRSTRKLFLAALLPMQRFAVKFQQSLSNSDSAEDRVRKTLRVSDPEGIQRSSYFVSMPWRYGLPLISSMSVLHWLVSQSIFVYSVDMYKPDGLLDPRYGFYSGAGFSIEPMICSICLGFVLIVALIMLGLRRYPPDMPLASTCSAAISAACHPPSDEEGDTEAYLFPVQWGVVSVKDGIGHCSLTTARDVFSPEVRKMYA